MEQPGQVLLCKAAQRQQGRAAGGPRGSDLRTRIWVTPGLRGVGIRELVRPCLTPVNGTLRNLIAPGGLVGVEGGGGSHPHPPTFPRGRELVPHNPMGLCCFHGIDLAECQHCKDRSLREVDAMER